MSLKKQFAVTLASVGLGAALIGGGTLAYFNDVETNSGNTFAAGTIDLTPETGGFIALNVGNLAPGQTSPVQSITINNIGTLAANASVNFDYTPNGGTDGGDLGSQLLVKNLKFGGVNIPAATIDALNGNDSELTLEELAVGTTNDNKLALGALGAVNGTAALTFEIEFKETNLDQNIFQGDSVSVELTFEARQQN